jgi:hypothetical protein
MLRPPIWRCLIDAKVSGDTSTASRRRLQFYLLRYARLMDITETKVTFAGVVTILHSFGDGSATNDGISPITPLVRDADGNFYGGRIGDLPTHKKYSASCEA